MHKPGKFHIFTLYFQETPDDEKWIDAWASIEALAYQAQNLQWRLDHEWKARKTFLDFFKSGIYIDTIEQPRVAVFISDEVEIEVAGKNGKPRLRTVKTWGCGGKTTSQLWNKLIALFTQVLEVLDLDIDLEPDVRRVDVMGLLGFIAYNTPKFIETNG